jgi:tetratricopeptide (TPR) repeat protein
MPHSDEPSAADPREDQPAASACPAADQCQLDFDIDFFQRVLHRYPDYVDVLRCQGQLLTRKGLHERALEVDRRLVELRPEDGVAHYNLACSLALGQRAKEAIEELCRALESGYDDFDYLEADSDLDSLRNHPAYAALLRRYGIGGTS